MNPGEIEAYEVSYNEFMKCIENATKVSEASGGIQCDINIRFPHNIYTKLLMNCIGIFRLSPSQHNDFWDFFSISTLTRSLFENYATFHYMSEISDNKDEEDFKIKLAVYHCDYEKYSFYKELNPNEKIIKEFEDGLPIRAKELENHPFFSCIPKEKKKKVLQGKMFMLYGNYEILKSISFVNTPITAMYRFYSNYTHSTALSTMTMSNERGRGIKNEAEVGHITYALEFSKLLLHEATRKLIKLLPEITSKLNVNRQQKVD